MFSTSLKVAASRLGMDFNDYLAMLSAGMKWCSGWQARTVVGRGDMNEPDDFDDYDLDYETEVECPYCDDGWVHIRGVDVECGECGGVGRIGE